MQTECSPLKIVRVPLALSPTAAPARALPRRKAAPSKAASIRGRVELPARERWDDLAWAAIGLATAAGLALSVLG